MSDDKLKKELQVYESQREKLVAESEGKYVVICGEEIKGVWDTYEDALQAGYGQCGLDPFLVRKIQGVDNVLFFTRDIPQCP